MENLWRLISEERMQYTVFLGLSAVVIILTGITYISNRASFQRFFGRINPLLAVFIVFMIGLILFTYLLSNGQFAVYQPGNYKGLLLAAVLALPFGIVIILIDRASPFPIDTNIPYPDSLTFYPVMGYVAGILFLLLPFCLAYFGLSLLLGEADSARIIWISILFAALFEPIFQISFMLGRDPNWKIAYVGLHIYLISLVQLLLFKRYDFITMYVFRLSYYLLWHILWGHLRLGILF
ncbi:MAG: hypothetical protein ACWGOY_07750 [Anaerolineales bacterium]